MKLSHFLPALSLFGILASTGTAFADPVQVADIMGSLSAANSRQPGRLSRSGVPTDFGTVKPYPGTINTTINYSYTTYTLPSSLFAGGQNVEVLFIDNDNTGTFFLSAYANTYNPSAPAANYLGDDGSSGNAFTTDGQFINLVLAANTNLVLVVNETFSGTTLPSNFGHGFEIVVQHSTNDAFGPYGEPLVASTPEPSSLLLLGTGVIGVVGAIRRRVWN